MTTEILCALIGLVGVLLGSIISYFAQLLLIKKQYNQQLKFEHIRLKQEVFPKAIKYIATLSRLEHTIDDKKMKKILATEKKQYDDFYFSLSLIATDKLLQQFNELRNKIQKEHLSQSQAVQEITKLLKSL